MGSDDCLTGVGYHHSTEREGVEEISMRGLYLLWNDDQYTSEAIKPDQIENLLQAGMYAPSANNLQPS